SKQPRSCLNWANEKGNDPLPVLQLHEDSVSRQSKGRFLESFDCLFCNWCQSPNSCYVWVYKENFEKLGGGGVDKVVSVNNEVFLIRFLSMEHRDKTLKEEHPFSDKKPVILKPWDPDMDYKKVEVKTIPTWFARCLIEVGIDHELPDKIAFDNEKEVEKALHTNPSNIGLRNIELEASQEYKRKHQVYMEFLRQKAKMGWIK
ncbi:Iron-sulfur cluster repair protein ScdA, partial [Bienertia sinuspersici]